jgi:hypothetical protein
MVAFRRRGCSSRPVEKWTARPLGGFCLQGRAARAPGTQDQSKNQLRSQGPGWGPDGSAGGAGAAFAPGYSVLDATTDHRGEEGHLGEALDRQVQDVLAEDAQIGVTALA